MVLKQLFASKWSRLFSLVSVLINGIRALLSGNRRVGALLVGVALLAYRWSPLGIVVTILMSLYGDEIRNWAMDQPERQP
ncbi:hypothetical protein halTADL_0590 [Halohasta litchfieldiae]|jgi:hypothetical protein|uniref:Uncharacterized protein n=1 Tax=Halohasta litchfieldiae TaxID=1073996 RepID=A0A1H6ULL3_9EURY|nr:hypothetical protein [Halohasta litchfieldiae]ATW87394.1 hypothetical protein halTADL_0590 [Halohasta litchfieldiae]SEI90617.1 hypothetical protein SAMN05444271_11155 [Halohasta litchfieldiae]